MLCKTAAPSQESNTMDAKESRARSALQELGLEIADQWATGFQRRPTQQLILQKIITGRVTHSTDDLSVGSRDGRVVPGATRVHSSDVCDCAPLGNCADTNTVGNGCCDWCECLEPPWQLRGRCQEPEQ